MYEGNTLYLYFLYKTKHSKQKQRKHKIFIDFAWKKANKKNLFFSHLVLKNKKRKVVLFYNGETLSNTLSTNRKKLFFFNKNDNYLFPRKASKKIRVLLQEYKA